MFPTAKTPEEIEAIPCSDLLKIKELAKFLHEETTSVLEGLHPKDVEPHEIARSSLSIKIDEAMSELQRQIQNLRAVRKDLEIHQSYLNSDKARIKSHKIGLFIQMREHNA